MPETTSESAGESEERYWYNLKTHEVEFGKIAAALYRVGPFLTRAEAENAPKLLADRAAAWREEDDSD